MLRAGSNGDETAWFVAVRRLSAALRPQRDVRTPGRVIGLGHRSQHSAQLRSLWPSPRSRGPPSSMKAAVMLLTPVCDISVVMFGA